MPHQVLLIQGGGEGAYNDDAKLAASLRGRLGPTYHVRYPAMPDEGEPDYQAWRRTILDEALDMGEGAILVGHSIGASVLIRSLTDQAPKLSIAGLFLIAGPYWHDHEFWHWDEVALPRDAGERCPRDVPLFLYHGEDDEVVPVLHLDMYMKALPRAVARRLRGRNHQLNDDMREVARDIVGLDPPTIPISMIS